MPGCKSVISVGVRLVDGAIQSIFRNFEDGKRMAQGIYGTYGYTIAPNFHLLYSVYDLAQFIERTTGFASTPTQVGPFQTGMTISQRHAAVAAGLGEFGWMSIVLTPQFGPRNRFGAVLTTSELAPDPLYKGEHFCDPTKCNVCTTVCPTGALSKYGEKEARRVTYPDKDGDRSFDYCHVDMTRCRIAAHKLMKKTGGAKDLVTSLDARRKRSPRPSRLFMIPWAGSRLRLRGCAANASPIVRRGIGRRSSRIPSFPIIYLSSNGSFCLAVRSMNGREKILSPLHKTYNT